jgi:hypothetical protein
MRTELTDEVIQEAIDSFIREEHSRALWDEHVAAAGPQSAELIGAMRLFVRDIQEFEPLRAVIEDLNLPIHAAALVYRLAMRACVTERLMEEAVPEVSRSIVLPQAAETADATTEMIRTAVWLGWQPRSSPQGPTSELPI